MLASKVQTTITQEPVQRTNDLIDLYFACHRVRDRFERVFEELLSQSGASAESAVVGVKAMYRAFEKTAFRTDGSQWSANKVLDILRGALRFDNMEGWSIQTNLQQENMRERERNPKRNETRRQQQHNHRQHSASTPSFPSISQAKACQNSAAGRWNNVGF